MDFIELIGLAGVTYRFRLVSTAHALPNRAGVFVVVAKEGPTKNVRMCGSRPRLSELAEMWNEFADVGDVYVRLNVVHASRALECRDLISAYRPASVLPELR